MGLTFSGRRIAPLVSTEWLNNNLNDPHLVIVDIRSEEEYQRGHIPNSVNVPFKLPNSAWAVARGGLLLEVPPVEDLFNTLGSIGVKSSSKIVVVGKTGHPFPVADAARVALTIIYSGVRDVGILNGGYDKWLSERRITTTEITKPEKTRYEGTINNSIFVSKEYVMMKVRSRDPNIIILDGRDPDVYFGVTVEEWVPTPGHIPGAKSLPAPWLLNKDWTYKEPEMLRKIVSGVVGEDKSKEIIVYCGVGGYASLLWFVLHEVLGYENVKMYDGSWQEWARRKPEGPISIYKWE